MLYTADNWMKFQEKKSIDFLVVSQAFFFIRESILIFSSKYSYMKQYLNTTVNM